MTQKKFLKTIALNMVFLITVLVIPSCTSQKNKNSRIIVKFAVRGESYKLSKVLKEEFEKLHPKIELELVPITDWGRYLVKIQMMLSAGTAPDVIELSHQEYYSFADKKVLLNLDDFIKNDPEFQKRIPDFHPNLLKPLKWKGSYYAVPAWCNPVVMYYNKDIFDKEGIPYPDSSWDWDIFLKNCKKFTKDINGDRKIDQYGTVVYHGTWAPLVLGMKGIDLLSKDGKDCNLDKPDAIKAMEWWFGLINKHYVSPTLAQLEETGGIELFMTGRVATVWTGVFAFREIKKVKFKWDIALLPKAKDKKRITQNWTILWSIPNQTKNPKETWEFVKFMNGPQGQKIRFAINSDVPVLKSVTQSEIIDTKIISKDNSNVISESFKYVITPVYSPLLAEITELLRSDFDKAMIGEQNVDEACKLLAKKIRGLLQNKKDK
jgi:multiple sugar transport system substrate-binding protein